ncbi:MAG: RNA 2',3'-cyclic phosphodiesterase [Alphaproteobacteria bacterium]
MIRLFVALALPETLGKRLAMLAGGVREARWLDIGNLHLTLSFIGDTSEDMVDDINHALEKIRADGFDMTLAGVGHFQSRKKVHALWAGIEANPALMDLQGRVASALMRAGCVPDRRRFTPHVTLARLKPAPPAHVRDWLEANSLFRADPVPVTGFTLFQSHLIQSGAQYQPLREFPLQAREAQKAG